MTMTAYEAVTGAIRDQQAGAWSEGARQRWIGYVAALAQLTVLTREEFFHIMREDLSADLGDQEMALYLQDTNLEGAADLVRRNPLAA